MTPYAFRFFRAGDVDQVLLRDGNDLAHLPELDRKLWMALSMPTKGIEFDARTLTILDTDKDGRLRPPEILAAIAWAQRSFKSLDALFAPSDSVPLSNIADPDLLAGARRILASLKKPEAVSVTLADVSDTALVFAGTVFNGDGVIIPDSADGSAVRADIEDILTIVEPTADRSGKLGLDQAHLDAFFTEADAYVAWVKRGEADLVSTLPTGPATVAVAALRAVRAKVDDYFTRCRLVGEDGKAATTLNDATSALAALAGLDVSGGSAELKAMPLARVEAGRALPLDASLNPAWMAEIEAVRTEALVPLLGARSSMSERDWSDLQAKLAPAEAWVTAKPAARVEKLGLPRLQALLAPEVRARLNGLVEQDKALEKEFSQIEAVEKLVRLQRDLLKLLTNFVNFAEFYARKGSLFQVGTLYLDARSCELCIDVTDPARHASLAQLSAAYIAYCDITRPGEAKRSIGAIFTDGDSQNLMVGRNGLFYDRQGRDWDATITKIVSNPISVREGFWLPYQKLARLIDDQITKRAQAADGAAHAQLAAVATDVTTADQTKPPPKPPEKKPLDLGAIALVGTAIGGVSALVGGFLNALFGLGIWMPLGVLGVLALISGPSMLLAYLKLRQRNLGPLLDANGWAINTKAKLNVPFGAALTSVAKTPRGAMSAFADPFAQKHRPWRLYLAVAAIGVLGYSWLIGRLDPYLPAPVRSATVLKADGSK
jgi:hypothetical protein